MAHYAFLDDNNIVVEVITGRDEDEVIDGISDWEEYYGSIRKQRCIRTSYNAKINGFRKNYAGIGYSYDELRDAFIPPQGYLSWTLNEDTCQWEAPEPYPIDGRLYTWNENHKNWEEVV